MSTKREDVLKYLEEANMIEISEKIFLSLLARNNINYKSKNLSV